MKNALATFMVLVFMALIAPVFFTVLAHPQWVFLMGLPIALLCITRVIYFACITDWSRNDKK